MKLTQISWCALYIYINVCVCVFNRINVIKFGLYFGATYKKGIIEDYNAVQVTFHVVISLENELYNNLAIDMDIVSTFVRISSDSWTRKTTTIIDTVVLLLLFMSSWTYVLSIFKTSRLAKVQYVYLSILYMHGCMWCCCCCCCCMCVCVCVYVVLLLLLFVCVWVCVCVFV